MKLEAEYSVEKLVSTYRTTIQKINVLNKGLEKV
jgi:hypothetical protein